MKNAKLLLRGIKQLAYYLLVGSLSVSLLAGCGDRMEHLDGEVARSSEQIKADSIEAVKKYRESDSMQQLQYEQDKIKEFANPVDSLKN